MNDNMNKTAMTQQEKNNWALGIIGSGALAAAIGAVIRDNRYKKNKAKSEDVYRNRNAIVVPIKKTKFMEGLPTPSELAAERGEAGTPQIGMAETPLLENHADNKAIDVSNLTPEEISAKKKDILKNNSKKFDFFSKAAEGVKEEPSDGKKPSSGDKKPDHDKDDGKKKDETEDGRILFRDQSGKFVSPTDPIAVAQVEKEAGFTDLFLHPIDSLASAGREFKDKPVWYSAGLLGSYWLATQIADAINEKRRKKSRANLDDARQAYVDAMQETDAGADAEKKAETQKEDDTGGMLGRGAGYMLFIPMALSALVTNRVIQNRKAEKKKKKELNNSYPEDPVVLYKTSEGKDMPVSLETVWATLMTKAAMLRNIELEESRSVSLEKEAQSVTGYVAPYTYGNAGSRQPTPEEEYTAARDFMIKRMSDPSNKQEFLNLIKTYNDPMATDEQKHDAAYNLAAGPWYKYTGVSKHKDVLKNPEFRRRFLADPKFQDLVMKNFENDDDFRNLRNEMIDDHITKNWGIEKGGIIHQILSWLAKNTGLGKWMFNRKMNNQFGEWNNAQQNAEIEKEIERLKKEEEESAAHAQQQANDSAEESEFLENEELEERRQQEQALAEQQAEAAKQQAPGDQAEPLPYPDVLGDTQNDANYKPINWDDWVSRIRNGGNDGPITYKGKPVTPDMDVELDPAIDSLGQMAGKEPVDPSTLGPDIDAAKALLAANGIPVAQPSPTGAQEAMADTQPVQANVDVSNGKPMTGWDVFSARADQDRRDRELAQRQADEDRIRESEQNLANEEDMARRRSAAVGTSDGVSMPQSRWDGYISGMRDGRNDALPTDNGRPYVAPAPEVITAPQTVQPGYASRSNPVPSVATSTATPVTPPMAPRAKPPQSASAPRMQASKPQSASAPRMQAAKPVAQPTSTNAGSIPSASGISRQPVSPSSLGPDIENATRMLKANNIPVPKTV